MTDYESIRQLIQRMPSASSYPVRDIKWTTGARVIGVSRDPDGCVEVFMAGPELHAVSAAIRDAMEFRVVHREHQSPFDANRLTFPALAHFDQVAAFICTELLRNGADLSLADAFAETEPIIELALEQASLSTQVVVGLAGELLLLDALCRRATDRQAALVVDSWEGWRRSSRDFTLGAIGVEVKTTTGSASSHFIEGVHQVERNAELGEQQVEERLFLVSIGVQPAKPGASTFTIPGLVDRVIERMRVAGLGDAVIGKFLLRVSEYSSGSGGGYDHATQASDPQYAGGFLTTFFRAYDMDDEAIRVLRRHDVTPRVHVDVNSVRFRVDLPATVSAGNPISGANQVADAVLQFLI